VGRWTTVEQRHRDAAISNRFHRENGKKIKWCCIDTQSPSYLTPLLWLMCSLLAHGTNTIQPDRTDGVLHRTLNPKETSGGDQGPQDIARDHERALHRGEKWLRLTDARRIDCGSQVRRTHTWRRWDVTPSGMGSGPLRKHLSARDDRDDERARPTHSARTTTLSRSMRWGGNPRCTVQAVRRSVLSDAASSRFERRGISGGH